MHSLGVILLEILVGTDVVLSCNGWEAVDDLIKDCEEYIDSDTTKLLYKLIRFNEDGLLEPYLDKVLTKKPEVIAQNVRGMNWASESVRLIFDRQ